MEARPDDIKRTTAGKLALATQVQSGVNMKPLFKQLRSKVSIAFQFVASFLYARKHLSLLNMIADKI